MFGRFVRPYRRARRYVKNRVYGRKGLNFLQVRSKIRKTMDPPSSKRRKFQELSQNLFSQDEEKKMGIESQTMGPQIAPLSMVRFKDISSTVFEYVHQVRRVQAATPIMTCGGAAASSGMYTCTATMGGLIPDLASLDNVFERIRITRVQWEFSPTLNMGFTAPTATAIGLPMVGSWIPTNADQALNPPTSWTDLVDEPRTKITKGNMSFTLDSLPVVCEQPEVNIDGVGFNQVSYNNLEAPWLPCGQGNATSFYSGVVGWYQPAGVANYTSQCFYVSVITWFDLDTVK